MHLLHVPIVVHCVCMCALVYIVSVGVCVHINTCVFVCDCSRVHALCQCLHMSMHTHTCGAYVNVCTSTHTCMSVSVNVSALVHMQCGVQWAWAVIVWVGCMVYTTGAHNAARAHAPHCAAAVARYVLWTCLLSLVGQLAHTVHIGMLIRTYTTCVFI